MQFFSHIFKCAIRNCVKADTACYTLANKLPGCIKKVNKIPTLTTGFFVSAQISLLVSLSLSSENRKGSCFWALVLGLLVQTRKDERIQKLNHELPKSRMDIFRKLMGRYWWTSPFTYQLIFKNLFRQNRAEVNNWYFRLKHRWREANIFLVLSVSSAWGRTVDFNVLFRI